MRAFITGINGQDGSYLAEFLLGKGYEVAGFIRRTSQPINQNIKHIGGSLRIYHGDMMDHASIHSAIKEFRPDEIYNLAGMSQVRWSFDIANVTMAVNCGGFVSVVEVVRSLGLDCKIYQASSSEMYGAVLQTPQDEKTPFNPVSPYGVSKAAAHYMAKVYRESYGMKIYCGILFNHESPRRGEEFLSRKVCKGVADIHGGQKRKIKLGNLDSIRDFGYAKEYVKWIWRIMQWHTPNDFIVATGHTCSIREFVTIAFAQVGIYDWEKYVEFDKSLLRPSEVDLLRGDIRKSNELLGFIPQVTYSELIKIMVEAELRTG